MTKDEILNSEQLLKRFCKDASLSINLYCEPYFTQRLKLFDEYSNSLEYFELFCDCLSNFDSEQKYFEYYNSLKDEIITHIQGNEAFQRFNDAELPKKDITSNTKNLYADDSVGKYFVSIDMRKANVSALMTYDNNIFDGCSCWEEFIGQFTPYTYIIKSKYIRQVILGACNPKRQISYESYIMSLIGKRLSELGITIYRICADELILESTGNMQNTISHIVQDFCQECNYNASFFRITEFSLEKKCGGYVKYLSDGSTELKCFDGDIMHCVIKLLNNIPLSDDDLVFSYKGMLAKFLPEKFTLDKMIKA